VNALWRVLMPARPFVQLRRRFSQSVLRDDVEESEAGYRERYVGKIGGHKKRTLSGAHPE
jgi:hypothetical protein